MKQTTNLAEFNSFAKMLEVLPDETACREYLELIRWNNIPRCPDCGSTEHYLLKTKGIFKGMRKCSNCKVRYTVTLGTMFEGSHIPLRKWFIAIYLFSSHKKGVSSHQLAKDLGLTQKTAWFMLGRIRHAFKLKTIVKVSGIVQADESFIGGKNKNRHSNKKVKESQGRSVKDKTPVFGLVHSGGDVHTAVVPDTKAVTLKPIIFELVEKGAIIVTDEWGAYNGLSSTYQHEVIKHNANEFMRDGFHTNNIENFWSHLKRGIYGIYHHVSPKHLGKYCDEFAFRYNARKIKDSDRFNFSLGKTEDFKMTYKQLIGK